MILTKHGKKRIKERLGLPKRAHVKHLKKVLEDGFLEAVKGIEGFNVVHHGFLYIFAFSKRLEPIFITTFPEK